MEARDFTLHGKDADFDFDLVVYGQGGRPVIVFPEGDSSCLSWENNGLIDAVRNLIEDGKVQLFCVDSRDNESWHAHGAFADYRLENLAGFFKFVEKELVEFVAKESASDELPLVVGCGIGALNAAAALLRRPELYGGLLALSGTLDARYHVDGEVQGEWLDYSPVDLLAQLTPRKKSVHLLEEMPLAFVCGQGFEEDAAAQTMRAIEPLFAEKEISTTFEYWGHDVSHDWYWWAEELRQMLPCLLKKGGLAERKLVAKVALAEAAADHAAKVLEERKAALESARAELASAEADAEATSERIVFEQEQVARCAADEEKLAEKARKAWAERDKIAAKLAEAIAKGNEAQAKADAAAHQRADAEWIAGEAAGAAEAAKAAHAAAVVRVAELEAACDEASASSKEAAAALDAIKKS